MPPRKASGSRGRGGKHGNASHLQHQLPVPASYPGLVEGKGLAESQWNACREILEGVYKAKDGNRRLVDIFRELPDKEEYEDYYQAIPEPECLDNISAQLEVQHYPNPEAFFKQLHLVFLNAKHYNEEESLLWSDAKRLEDQIHSEWTARAEAGVFTHPDPYHSTAGRPRKKRGTSTVPSKSATPLPDTTTKGTPGRGSVPPTIAETKAATPAVELPTILEKEREQESSSRASTSSTPLKVKVPIPTPLKASTPNPKITTASAPPPAPVQVPAPIPAPAAARTPLTAPVAALSPIPKPQLPTSAPVQTLQTAMQRPSTPSRVNSQPTTTPASPSVSDKARQTQAEIDRKVVAALDAVLPRWPGPQPVIPGNTAPGGIFGSGWFGEGAPDYERSAGGPAMWPHRIRAVVDAIASYRDQHGYRLAEVLDILPVHAEIPYLSFHGSISFASINDLAKAGQYSTLRDFDIQMTQLFEKARRYFHDGSVEYGSVLVLQRLYNALTAVYPMPLPASGIPSPSPTLFASLPAGPGNARSLHETTQELKAGASEDDVGFGITTFRVGTKDRQFTDEARHKGISYKLGDYVHLINPDDATRPIIGQIFKTFVPTKGYRTHHVTVCWYFRPEQTVHTPDRRFYEREVFKTGHFCDHPVEDILEKISVQFYVKYIRGRPRAGEYYPGWPIYICHSRFNDREYLSVRIKNWNSCIPDELRQTEFMSVIPFERNIEVPMVSSPFLRGVKGPGFFGEPKKGSAGDDEDDDEDEKEPKEKEKPRRRERAKRDSNVHAPSPSGHTSYNAGVIPAPYVPSLPSAGAPQTRPQIHTQPSHPSPSPGPAYSAPAPQPPSHSQPAYQARPTLPKSQSSSSSSLPTVPVAQSQSSNSFPNRTIAAVMGGPQLLDQTANKEVLPPDTARLFDRDARGNVLWFSGPPLPTGSMPIPTQQAHSLEYLAYLTKRKRGEGYVPLRRVRRRAASARNTEKEGGEDPMVGVEPTPWWAEGQSQEEVEASLWAVIESA